VIYKKAFVLSNAAKQRNSVGEIVNHQSTDAQRISGLVPYLHLIWSAPYACFVVVVVCCVLLFVFV
jgi:hypothetical protein